MPRASSAAPKDAMPLARFRPTQAMAEQRKSSPTGEIFRVRSMKCAQKRRPNMIEEVQMKRYLPCSEVNRLPVMF